MRSNDPDGFKVTIELQRRSGEENLIEAGKTESRKTAFQHYFEGRAFHRLTFAMQKLAKSCVFLGFNSALKSNQVALRNEHEIHQ